MQKTASRAWLTHVIAVVLLLLIPILYFNPVLGGKKLEQSDTLNFRAMSKEVVDHRDQYGEEPLWTNSQFVGMPAYQISMKNPGNLLQFIGKILPRPISFVFLAMLGMYILMLTLRTHWSIAFMSALAYGLGTYFITIIATGHNTKADALGWMPLAIAGFALLFRGRWVAGAGLAGLAMGMQVAVNHLQITYYLAMLGMIWGASELFYAWREGRLTQFWKAVVLIVALTGLGVGISAPRVMTTLEYAGWTIRGPSELTGTNPQRVSNGGLDRDYVFQWSYGISESLTLMFPNFAGGGSSENFLGGDEPNQEVLRAAQTIAQGMSQAQANQLTSLTTKYWGPLPITTGPVYIGAIICFLFLVGCFLVPARWRTWLIIGTIWSLLLSWGKHLPGFNFFLFDFFPGYDKFRAVSTALVIADVTVVIMAGMALQRLFFSDATLDEKKKALIYAGGITGMLTLIILMAGTLFDPVSAREKQILVNSPGVAPLLHAVTEARTGMMRGDAFRTLFLIVLSGGVIWATITNRLKPVMGVAVISLLVAVDLLQIDLKYLSPSNFKEETQYEAYFLQNLPQIPDEDPHYRVVNRARNGRLDQDGLTPYLYHSIGGYHGAKSRRFQDLVNRYGHSLPPQILHMFNTKWEINQQNKPRRRPGALGHAWYVREAKYAPNPDAEIAMLDNLRPSNEVVISENDRSYLDGFSFPSDSLRNASSITLKKYRANRLTYTVNNMAPQLAVFPEAWYRGNQDWISSVDGEVVEHIRVNWMLRGMVLPAGQHEVVFEFDPPAYRNGVRIAQICSIIVLLLLAYSIFSSLRGINAAESTEQVPA